MDIGINNIVTELASSTTGYLSAYSSLFYLIIGLVLAVGLSDWLIDLFMYNAERRRGYVGSFHDYRASNID